MKRSLGVIGGAVVVASLGCAGAPTTSELARFPVPTSGYLLQRADGLWDADGKLVAPLGGEWEAWDLYVADASLDRFFLLSDGDTVRVARRDGDEIVVTQLLEGARVVRPVGRVAAIVDAAGGSPRIIDAEGKVLHEGLVPAPSDLDVSRPEYWWTPTQTARPAPFCHATDKGYPDTARCGWIDADGRWLVEGEHRDPTGFEPGYASAGKNPLGTGAIWVDPSGALLTAPGTPLGPPTEDGVWIDQATRRVETDNPADYARSEHRVVGLDGAVRGTVDPSVVTEIERRCTDQRGCAYRFHEGRAPVWVTVPGKGYGTAWLGTDGKLAIAPVPCAADTLSGPFHDGRAFQCEGEAFWLVDRDGKRLAGPYPAWERAEAWDADEYPAGLFFAEGLAAVPVDGGWGYVDRDGKLVLPGPYAFARPFRLGFAKVVQGDDAFYIRQDGTRALDAP